MAVVSFAVINLFDFIQKAKKEYDDIHSFSVLLFIRQRLILFFSNIIRGIAKIEMKQSTACEHI